MCEQGVGASSTVWEVREGVTRVQHFSWSSEDFEICQRKRAGRTGELQRYRGMDELVESGAGAMFHLVRRLGLR